MICTGAALPVPCVMPASRQRECITGSHTRPGSLFLSAVQIRSECEHIGRRSCSFDEERVVSTRTQAVNHTA